MNGQIPPVFYRTLSPLGPLPGSDRPGPGSIRPGPGSVRPGPGSMSPGLGSVRLGPEFEAWARLCEA